MLVQHVLSGGLVASAASNGAGSFVKPSTFTAPGAFPTTAYHKYYNNPTQTSAQVQPVVTDPVSHVTYPLALTDPDHIPKNDTTDPHPLPPRASDSLILQHALEQIRSIASNANLESTCAKCQAGLEVAKFVALAAPEMGPELAVTLCDEFEFSNTCGNQFSVLALGSVITQVVANADVAGLDGQLLCQNFLGLCPLPPASPVNLTNWFAKPKPSPLPPPKKPSGKLLKVLHISDIHLDPRYATGAEANCTSGLCCRTNNVATSSPNVTLLPAPRFGSYLCDTPYSLLLSALQAIPKLAGTEEIGFAYSVFTGDLVSHDPENQLSRSYVEYTETVLYDLLKRFLGNGPVYAVLGNHDTYNQAQDAPHAISGSLAEQFNWNYDHVSSLWSHENWLPEAAVQLARAHYAAYMVKRSDGLRIITLNTDMWYRSNYFNYINMSTSDNSGMLRFLTDELQDAEDAGDRVWILGHVLSGWDGTNPLANPTNLFYQIVDRFSPHVIANIFWGHTHEDQLSIFYANNGTIQNAQTAQTVSWVGPSLTPLTNLNSGFRVYVVDSATFDIIDAYTWKADVDTFSQLDHQLEFGPSYGFEYSTRQTYGGNITWHADAPLNATWWHLVTEQMESDPSLMETFTRFQGKESVRTQPCTDECVTAKVCYMRSGSASIARQNCATGFGSVQGG
ncbi:Metallo-dependent phosphatase [Punctularia strigosozonata HHB-11173 SS5]|uniref:Metallo-dependent phosphatase n=1 Tax=Punctularia strigosozonata (strain HHB-11173) TaxID=741275 RepID=UPI000441793E|nr:Metallo-dependent phosphatase [Punctularia strigosozonata HHB-11173 SS5]EIN13842.1 Metallo-dependent phosphatase [Punctularia strigosozonata HHB-11173 SS5]